LGETMAVTFVLGNAYSITSSLLMPGTSISSAIANEFNEAVGMHRSALIALGFLLFVAWILWVTLKNGFGAISPRLFTKITAYAEQGGLSNAIVGSLIMDLMALLI